MADAPAEPGHMPDGSESEEEEYFLVGSDGSRKRPRVTSADGTTNTNEQLKFTIAPIQASKNLSKINPLKISKELNRLCGVLKYMKKVGRSLVAACHNSRQAQQLREVTRLCDIDVKVTEGSPLDTARGVIMGVELDITEPELLEELSDIVSKVKRMTKKIDGKIQPIGAVILDFKNKLPAHIFLGYEKKKVSEYHPPVQRCFNCQRYGHSAGRCNAKPRCARCGQNHKWEDCPNRATPKCANCGGEHSAAYLGCPKYQVAKSIQTIKINHKLNYAEATKKFISESKSKTPLPTTVHTAAFGASLQRPAMPHPPPPPPPTQPPFQQPPQAQAPIFQPPVQPTMVPPPPPQFSNSSIETQTDTLPTIPTNILNEQLVAFLAFIINNLDENKSKSNRIKLVVDAAEKCCGVSISPDKVYNILKQ